MDCPQSKIWRNKHKKDYKGGRVDLSEKANFKPTFEYTYSTLIPSLVNNNNHIFSMKRPKIEGDDIIALCTKYIRIKHPKLKVYLVSGDQDFYQLGYPNLYFCDYKKEHLNLTRKEAKQKLEEKIIMGDKSDNICSIFPKNIKIPKNRKETIKINKIELKKYLKEFPEVNKIYKLNKILINFNNIPKEYHKKVYKKIRKILN